jgi:drug/metabolite transporter (DMT)-like permease
LPLSFHTPVESQFSPKGYKMIARIIFTCLAMTAAIAGTMLMMAAHQTDLLPQGLAKILGVGCFMSSGMFWMLYGITSRCSRNRNGTGELHQGNPDQFKPFN